MGDFKATEERILKFWEDHDVFRRSVHARKKEKPFVFYEGPPTANAAPAIHHFIGRVFKDAIPRYQTMRGRHVLRKGGWDTHGLPVELQVEKALGFTTKKDIETYGIAPFNRKCRESVWEHKQEWEAFTRRIGYWVDLDDPYVTYETPYVESLWAVIGKFNARKLLYQAHRVVPFCTRCGTPLSSHEVNLGYKTVTDTSVYLKFRVTKAPAKLKLPEGTAILAWTTTPWTLPGNVALAVGPDVRYVLARKGEEHFIVAEELAHKVLGAPLAIERALAGRDLVGIAYEPLFPVAALKGPRSYRVYPADFVTTTDGTGVVHTAVMYGEDDYRLGDALKLPKKHTVTEQGTFVGVSKELDGMYVKSAEAEQAVLSALERRGLLLAKVPYEHEYPFCWRCDTPLLYYAKDSWFVRMSAVNKELQANNKGVHWVPAHLKEGRFGQWLKEARDWAFSRERYWGTPLPIWRSRDGKQTVVAGSLADLDTYRGDNPATFWVVRHGESTKNVAGIIDQGEGESPLTDAGRKQAIKAAGVLRRKLGGKKPVAIVASPVQRTRETAELIARELGVKAVVYDERLREIKLGPSLVGCHDAQYHERYPTYEQKFRERPPGGESLADLRARMWGVLRELNGRYAGKQVVIVSHEYPIWMLTDAANGWSMAESIAEKERRGPDFAPFAAPEKLVVRNLPRDEEGTVDPHRPYVDDIVLRKGKTLLYRVPEVADVWFDSGAMPYAQRHWLGDDKALGDQFPADFIAEGIDQTRGWFYTLLAVSTALGKGAPYRNVLSYSHVLDEKGQKMSKSKGNVVKPDDVFREIGVDAARWYFYTVNNPGDPKMFSMKEARERLTGFLSTLENCAKFWELYAHDPAARNFSHGGGAPGHALDRWVLSRLHRVIGQTTRFLDAFDLTGAARGIERFVVDDLSQWWLRRSRKRSEALGLLRHVLLEVDKLIAPFIPFTAEDLHLRLHAGTAPATLSVHLHDWPKADAGRLDDALEQAMERVRESVSAGLAIRKQEGIKVRQPLAAATLPGEPLAADLEALVRDELNVKEVRYASGQPVSLETAISPELRAEGWAREAMRAIQDMRKEAGCSVTDRVRVEWSTADDEVTAALERHRDTIMRDTGLSAFIRRAAPDTGDLVKEFALEPGRGVTFALRR